MGHLRRQSAGGRARRQRWLAATAALVAFLPGCTADDSDQSSQVPIPCANSGGLAPVASAGGAADRRQSDIEPTADRGGSGKESRATADEPLRVLVFTRTEGFRHPSIDNARAWFDQRADDGLDVTATEETDLFTATGLAEFDVVAFVNTTGDVLDEDEAAAFQEWVETGGGFVGVHSAADTEHESDWYGELVGGHFTSHPLGLQDATLATEAPEDPTVAHLPETWEFREEYYNFDRNPRRTADVLLSLDEETATFWNGDDATEHFTMRGDHPIAWSRDFGDGRSWYTNLGHTPSTWDDERFTTHVLEGIRWAAAPGRWAYQVAADDLESPTVVDVAASGLVFYAERGGTLNRYDPNSGAIEYAGSVPTRVAGEGGFVGMRLAPDAAETGHVYVYFTSTEEPDVAQGRSGRNILARYTLDADCVLDPESQLVLLEVPNDDSGHQGGDILIGPDGNLLLGTGDNTDNVSDGFAPIDPDPSNPTENALRTSGNPDDLRGKILRIATDGSIPEGNMFPGGEGGLPEIYVMGVRNPYRLGTDPGGTRLWWGDIGPDALTDGQRGPRGYDELNVATTPGDYGWPRCIADKLPYLELLDADAGTLGEPFDCDQTVAPLIAYDYVSLVDPALGIGAQKERFSDDTIQLLGRALMVGPWYEPAAGSPYSLPIGSGLVLHEFARHRLLIGEPADDGSISSLRRIAPWLPVNTPVDVEVGPDGSLWVLETGKWSSVTSGQPRLSRIAWSPNGPVRDLPETRRVEAPSSDADFRSGEELYQLHCAACHGADGDGGSGPSLVGVADRLRLDEHLEVVRKGRGEMPAWGDALAAEEIDAIVDYERGLVGTN